MNDMGAWLLTAAWVVWGACAESQTRRDVTLTELHRSYHALMLTCGRSKTWRWASEESDRRAFGKEQFGSWTGTMATQR